MPGHEHLKSQSKQRVTQKERDSAKAALKEKYGLSQILGKSKAIKEIHARIRRVAKFDVNVLITGESGTGKELVARAIHYLGPRAGKPFIPVNCGAIPENLFENELYGHVKGAFTDANHQQVGLVQAAEGGTLFLDEIGTISSYIQVKLLRLLENREYKALGDSRPNKANIRIIAATNKPRQDLIRNGDFRDDLYYRLNVIFFYIPPLRERKEDIPLLINHFIKKYAKKYNRPNIKISPEAFKALVANPWKGNIRELENKIQQCIILSESTELGVKQIPAPEPEAVDDYENLRLVKLPEAESMDDFEKFKLAKMKTINNFEKNFLIRILSEHNGNVASAAVKLGKGRTALWNLIKKHNLHPKQFRL